MLSVVALAELPQIRLIPGRHDVQHNNTQYNDIQHKGLICDFQLKDTHCNKCHYAERLYSECRDLLIDLLSVVMLNVVVLNVVAPSPELHLLKVRVSTVSFLLLTASWRTVVKCSTNCTTVIFSI